jgi:ferredoxin-NADP reductase
VLSFVFESEDQSPLPSPRPGQFLAFKIAVDEKSEPLMRSYSISGPAQTGTYRISVKRGRGEGSQRLHEDIRVGSTLQVSAPRGNFALIASRGPVVLLSAGIGVTPVLAMLHSLAAERENTAEEVWWCYGARNGKEHPFADEVANLLKALPNSRSFIAYSKPDVEDQLGVNYDAAGHLSLATLQTLQVSQASDFYLCGPPGFLAEITQGLQSWGVADSRIHSETFGAESAITPGIAVNSSQPPHPPAENTGTGPKISFARSGLVVPWNSRFGSLLEFSEACDVPVRWSCRVGVCHTCESGLIDGKVSYSSEPLDPPSDGHVLICCSTPKSEIILDL